MSSKAKQIAVANPLDDLTTMQRLYVEGRLQGMVPVVAARAAGMAEASIKVEAYAMEKHPKIKAAIRHVLDSSFNQEVTREYVLNGFKDAVSAAKDSTEMTAAFREMGKLLGLYAAEKRIEIQATATIDDIRSMSDAELMNLGKEGVAEGVDMIIDGDFEEVIKACEELPPKYPEHAKTST